MEFEVSVAQISAPVWNKDDVKAAVAAKLVEYENAVYTPETIQTAKTDRADLNKIAKAIEDERKRVKATYNAPYLVFEKEVKEITNMIDKAVSAIDAQVKAFEAKAREEKLATVKAMYAERDMRGVPFETVFNDKWLNATASLTTVGKEMDKIAENIAADMSVLQTITEYQFEAIERYKATRSLAEAMKEVNGLKDMELKKAQYEAAKRAEPTPVPVKNEVQEVVYDEDGLPDFDAIGDGRYPFIVKAKVTDAEKVKILDLLAQLNVEFEIIGG